MILVDTSVWIDHLRGGVRVAELPALLRTEKVVMHPWVIGELALGHLGPQRDSILADLKLLPAVEPVADEEIRSMIEARELWATGLGWVDAGLLAAALVTNTSLWTLDRPLGRVASECAVSFEPLPR